MDIELNVGRLKKLLKKWEVPDDAKIALKCFRGCTGPYTQSTENIWDSDVEFEQENNRVVFCV